MISKQGRRGCGGGGNEQAKGRGRFNKGERGGEGRRANLKKIEGECFERGTRSRTNGIKRRDKSR